MVSPLSFDAIVEPFEVAAAGERELLLLGFAQMADAIDGGQPFRQEVAKARRGGQSRGPVAQHELIELVGKDVRWRVEDHAGLRRIVPRKELAGRGVNKRERGNRGQNER